MSASVGIRSYGCYVPRARLALAAIAEAWGRGDGGGGGTAARRERSVALHDEDALTMAVEAGAEALIGIEAKSVGALYFASSSSPFGEKQAADVVAAALDLRSEVITADFTGSTRAFSAALRAACDAVRAGSCRNVLVVATEMRQAEPGSGLEPLVGDAAAAMLISADDLVAQVEHMVSASDEFTPVWRLAGDRFLRMDDEKVATEAYVSGSLRIARRVLEAAARDPGDIARVVVFAPDAGSYRALLKASGMGEKFPGRQLLGEIGSAGAAHLPLALCGALAEAAAGDRILAVNWGGGADGLLLRVTGAADSQRATGAADFSADTPDGGSRSAKPRVARPLAAWLESRETVTYQDYLRFRELVAAQSGRLDPFASLTAERREVRETLRLHGKRCGGCGTVLYPMRPACRACGATGPFEIVRLARRGTIVTWTRDHVFPGPGAPVANVVIDLEGGGRLITQMSEGLPAIGSVVELTLRKFHEGKGIPHYWWKAREPRGVPARDVDIALDASGVNVAATAGGLDSAATVGAVETESAAGAADFAEAAGGVPVTAASDAAKEAGR